MNTHRMVSKHTFSDYFAYLIVASIVNEVDARFVSVTSDQFVNFLHATVWLQRLQMQLLIGLNKKGEWDLKVQ